MYIKEREVSEFFRHIHTDTSFRVEVFHTLCKLTAPIDGQTKKRLLRTQRIMQIVCYLSSLRPVVNKSMFYQFLDGILQKKSSKGTFLEGKK